MPLIWASFQNEAYFIGHLKHNQTGKYILHRSYSWRYRSKVVVPEDSVPCIWEIVYYGFANYMLSNLILGKLYIYLLYLIMIKSNQLGSVNANTCCISLKAVICY